MKYVTRAYWASHNDPWGPAYGDPVTATEVIESDKEPTETGLLDQHGDKIYRLHETVPFGFRSR